MKRLFINKGLINLNAPKASGLQLLVHVNACMLLAFFTITQVDKFASFV